MRDLYTSVMICAATVPAVLFVIVYALYSPGWWRTPIGRGVMTLALSLALILSLVAAALLFGQSYLGRTDPRRGIYTLLAVALWQQLLVLLLVQRRARRLRT